MRTPVLLLAALLLLAVSRPARAQQPPVSPEQQTAMLQAGRLLNDPVAFVLLHRQELALTGTQVRSLEALATALRDSAVARTALRTSQARRRVTQPGLVNAMAWSGPIDDAAIREAVRDQSALQAEIMIASARDRRAVGALLTPAQRAQLPGLQTAEMLKAARAGGR